MSLLPAPDFGLLFAALPTPHLALSPDDQRVVAANAAMAQWLQRPSAELAGAPAAAILPLAPGSSWESLLATLRQQRHEHTVLVLTPTGPQPILLRPVPTEPGTELRYVLALPAPATGPPSAAAPRPQEQFRLLSEFIPQLVWTTTAQGQPDYFNQRWRDYTGHAGLLAADPNWSAAVHPADAPAARQGWQQALSTAEPYRAELRLRDHDGRYRWFLVQALPLRTPQGRTSQWLGTCTDIDDAKRVQQRLLAKDRQLQQILSEVPAYVATLFGAEHICSFVTPNFQELLGGRLRAGWSVNETVPEFQAQGLVALLDEAYHTGRTLTQQARSLDWLSARSGQRVRHYYDLILQPLFTEQGLVQGVLFFAIDATERVLAQRRSERLTAAGRRRNEQVRAMTEALPLISFSQAPSGRVVYVSPQWEQFTGVPAPTATGRDWRSFVHPNDLAAVATSFARARRNRTPWTIQLRLRGHDGRYRWHLARSLPVFDAQGRLHRWYGSLTDVNDQQVLHDRLRGSEEQFRFLADSIPQLVWTLEPDGMVSFLNEEWLKYTGLTLSEVRASGWEALVPDTERELATQTLADNVRTGQLHEHENRLRRAADGQYRWHLHRARPMLDGAGRIVRWFGTSTDIDDYKRFQHEMEARNAELERINQDLDNFVYTASHDLRQPIDNMAGIFQELTRSAHFDDPDAPALVTMFEHSLEQIYTTIQELAALVRAQKQSLHAVPEEVRLERLTQEVLHSIGEQIRHAGAVVETDFEPVPAVEFIRPNLQSVLYNLISNAVKYRSPDRKPHIRVWTERADDGGVVLTVQDNGLGIDLERHGPELFQLFRRFHDHVPGSGTGLYLVQRLVQAHGGRLEVASRLGEGTTFRVKLPAGVGR